MSAGVSAITQAKRFLYVDTPLGKDVLLIEGCLGTEGVSSLFSFDLDLLLDRQQTRSQSIAADALIAKKVTVGMELEAGHRYLNGIVKRFTQAHRDERFVYYHAEIVPWLWLLTQKSNCRIFQNLSVLEIVKKVFEDVKGDFSDLVSYRDATTGSYVKWDYCVQYRETDFNFISRLLEQDGIYYYFEHTKDKHTLVLADAPSSFPVCADQSVARFEGGGYAEREDTITGFVKQAELHPGKFKARDHHFEMPSKTLEKSELSSIKVGGNEKLEIYDYPGEYALRFNKPESRLGDVEPTGESLVRVRMEEEEAAYETYTGTSNCRGFSAGTHFELIKHYDMDDKYVLLSIHHTMVQNPHYVSGAESTNPYQNSFVAIPYGTAYRPRRNTPKPVVQGPHTAVVTVKSGEESWLDKYGRVRVQFHWDREGKDDENSTCWLRVTQAWAGNTWGAHFWPRVGQEVIVDFLEGDPDQPIITGCVYNAAQMPPYELPKFYTRSGVKTRSSKNGGSSNYNEIRLEDKKGDEQIFINAEKDMDLRVEHDSREYVGNDSHQIIKGGRVEQNEKDKHVHLKADYFEKVDANVNRKVGSDEKEEISGNRSQKVNGSVKEKVGMDMSLSVGTSYDHKVGTTHAVEAGQTIHLKGGMTVIIEAGMQLTIKAAGGFVDIGPAGVTIQGTLVNINSGGAAGSGPGCNPQSPDSPDDPKDPDVADDGSKGGKLN